MRDGELCEEEAVEMGWWTWWVYVCLGLVLSNWGGWGKEVFSSDVRGGDAWNASWMDTLIIRMGCLTFRVYIFVCRFQRVKTPGSTLCCTNCCSLQCEPRKHP